MNSEVDKYLDKLKNWNEEITLLRSFVLECGLTEEFKWKHPCYSLGKKNILLIHEFKDYCAVLFMKGALLNDGSNILVQQTKNTQTGRQIRFTNTSEIIKLKKVIKEYIFEAIEVEKEGLKVKKKKTTDYEVPEELKLAFKDNPQFEIAFKNLTPGRQRGYLLHFGGAKQSKTRTSRIEKNKDRILKNFGLNDCICGRSKRMPNCDGSHKYINN
ncbi:DUF1801 domain-containing protein [Brumimicrobium mesophilum]|uniref:DUF1801 domain-containing protein n=1 Tax=Brumimicrobium mesophilum TaxID=392717 RepID=UPI000D143591|nr:DUF1801 domain-containing protein [Brumimicrobium mesophilum]